MTPPDISSPQNPRVKAAVRLRQRRERDSRGLFIVEGEAEIRHAIQKDDLVIRDLFHAVGCDINTQASCQASVSDGVMEKLALRGADAGAVAVCEKFDTSPKSLSRSVSIVLVAESIEKPGNLGAMLRTADAAGAGVFVCDPIVDLFSPQVVRASLGSLFTVPIAQGSFAECSRWTSHHQTVVGTPEAPRSLYEMDLRGPTAVVIGNEAQGVSEAWKSAADVQCQVPMAGQIDSLNASTTAAIMLFEAVRQRGSTNR